MKDIFKDAKFGNRFTCVENGREDDCVFLEKMDFGDNCPSRYKLARKIDVKYEDGGEKSFTSEIIADKDGNVYEGCYIKRVQPVPMTEEYLLSLGYTKSEYELDEETKFICFQSPSKRIEVRCDCTNYPEPYIWWAHVDDQNFQTIGSLDFAYVNEFNDFLKLCGEKH